MSEKKDLGSILNEAVMKAGDVAGLVCLNLAVAVVVIGLAVAVL